MIYKLAVKNLLKKPVRSLLLITAVSISIITLTGLSAFSQGLKNYISDDQNSGELNQIEILPKNQLGGYFNLIDSDSTNSSLNQNDINKLANLEGIESIYPQDSLKGISSIQINLLGQWLQSDALIFSLPLEAFEDLEIDPQKWTRNDENIPIIISSQLVDLYNFSFANNNNLPIITADNLIGTKIKILLNESTFFGAQTNQTEVFNGEIVGFSNKAKIIGITIPPAQMNYFNEKLNQPQTTYINAKANIKPSSDIEMVKSQIESLGYEVNSPNQGAEQANNILSIFNFSLSMIVTIILLMSALMIATSFLSNLNERIKDIGILKSMGATKTMIRNTFLTEALIIGLISGIFGYLTAYILAKIADSILLNIFSALIFKPKTLFSFDPIHFIQILSFSIIFCLFFTLIPANKAAKLDPISALNR
ncbi:FtsX-like permease family protein [Candidatus Peregrinibacteria bacterium]|nr:FtsX-like permease family protein [Candidatus Peregrinibacteria bacterium]